MKTIKNQHPKCTNKCHFVFEQEGFILKINAVTPLKELKKCCFCGTLYLEH